MIFEKHNSKLKENNQENNKSEGRRRKYFKTCELCWMLLKIKKYKRQQVIIKFGKATMIIVVSMKCGMWRHFKWFQEKSGRWRGSKDVIANNFFKWFYCGISEKCNHRWKEWDERTACTIFFLIIRDLMHVSLLSELVRRRKRNQPCKKEGLIKEQNPWDGRADGIQSRKG